MRSQAPSRGTGLDGTHNDIGDTTTMRTSSTQLKIWRFTCSTATSAQTYQPCDDSSA